MTEKTEGIYTPSTVLKSKGPLVLSAILEPVGGLDRFQPAGFPEVGHVFYKAPRENGCAEHVCIVDSPSSMANHLESVCMRGAHDFDLNEELKGMPYLRCVTGEPKDGKLALPEREVVVTSLTEGHRIASTYFLEGEHLTSELLPAHQVQIIQEKANRKKEEGKKSDDAKAKEKADKDAKGYENEATRLANEAKFQSSLIKEFGIVLSGSSKAHPPAAKWWAVYKTIFKYDPNALVHGVLFPQWQIKIPRVLTAHLEAFGASRVDRSGVKFDRLGKTNSGQPIFAIDETMAREIRATFIIDVAMVRSFGRWNGEEKLGLNDKQKEFVVALALWKINRLLDSPFRFRSGCYLKKKSDPDFLLQPNIQDAISQAEFENSCGTDIYWPREKLYREGGGGTEAGEDGNGSPAEGDESDSDA